jgi:hypothetical protein
MARRTVEGGVIMSPTLSTVIASAAKQSIEQHAAPWIASSQVLLAMTETAIDRHPEVAASSAALEGRQPGSVILRGSQELAPQDDAHNATLRQLQITGG